jgi:hypothetical protein
VGGAAAAAGDAAGGGGAAGGVAGVVQEMGRVGREVRATMQQQVVRRGMMAMRLGRVHPAGPAATGTGGDVGVGAGATGRVGSTGATTVARPRVLQSR